MSVNVVSVNVVSLMSFLAEFFDEFFGRRASRPNMADEFFGEIIELQLTEFQVYRLVEWRQRYCWVRDVKILFDRWCDRAWDRRGWRRWRQERARAEQARLALLLGPGHG